MHRPGQDHLVAERARRGRRGAPPPSPRQPRVQPRRGSQVQRAWVPRRRGRATPRRGPRTTARGARSTRPAARRRPARRARAELRLVAEVVPAAGGPSQHRQLVLRAVELDGPPAQPVQRERRRRPAGSGVVLAVRHGLQQQPPGAPRLVRRGPRGSTAGPRASALPRRRSRAPATEPAAAAPATPSRDAEARGPSAPGSARLPREPRHSQRHSSSRSGDSPTDANPSRS